MTGSTAIFTADPGTNSLAYRGYPVEELCRRHSFEEVAFLLWHGELPTNEQIFRQNRVERAQRALDAAIAAIIADQPFEAHPMDVLRTAVSLVGVNDCERQDADPAAIHAKALRLLAVLPTVIAMDQRRRHGLGAIAPRNDIGYAANFLYMTFGKVPEPQIVAAFETSLILGAGHSANAAIPALTAGAVTPSTFDIYNAVVGAIDAFKGSPAADASDAVMAMMNEIAVPDNARPWLEAALVDGRKIMGFGHRVYQNGDPRVPVMRARLGMIAALRRGSDLLEIHDTLAATMYDAKGLRPNLGYPVGLAYHLIGFDASTFTPILAAVCLPGWTAAIVDLIAADSPFSP